MTSLEKFERVSDIFIPLVVLSGYLIFKEKGFLTIWPIIASTVFAIVQPFVRFFLMDKIRPIFVEADREQSYLILSAVLYSGIAMVIVEMLS